MGHDIEILIDCAIINTQAYLSAPVSSAYSPT
jgi:hypothetical protein